MTWRRWRSRLPPWWATTPLVVLVLAGLAILWWRTPPGGLDGLDGERRLTEWSYYRLEGRRLEAAGSGVEPRHRYVPLSSISLHLQVAVLAAEDVNFLGHGPWDPEAIREALEEWWRGEELRGASTITQQLAKNLWLRPDRSPIRKLREAKVAWWLERRLDKRRILELYLNAVEMGEGIFGVEAGARRHYGVSAADVDVAQAAGLAATIPSPRRHNPTTATRAWTNRRAVTLKRIEDLDWLYRALRRIR